MTDSVQVTIDDDVAVVRIDDGKANALSSDLVAELHAALDRAQDDARAVCFVGREGKFCAGYDLAEMTAGIDSTRALVGKGGELLMRIYGFGMPTVAAVTGHALAGGALFVLSCDTRIGADVAAKIGLNETAIGMGLPKYAVELARERLSKRHFTRAAIQADLYTPAEAVDAGYLDRVVPAAEVTAAAIAEAKRLGELSTQAYATTKRQSRGELITKVLDELADDMETIVAPKV